MIVNLILLFVNMIIIVFNRIIIIVRFLLSDNLISLNKRIVRLQVIQIAICIIVRFLLRHVL